MTSHLYSYVVEHDHGWAPNPQGNFCTLVYCKFSKSGRRKNLVENISEGDWILGTGGSGQNSSGHGTILYLMRVDKILPLQEYLAAPEFEGRIDCRDLNLGNRFALVSSHYFYFGNSAVPISELPSHLRYAQLEKRGPSYRKDLPPSQVKLLIEWFESRYKPGCNGEPCSPMKNWSAKVVRSRIILKSVRKCRQVVVCSEA